MNELQKIDACAKRPIDIWTNFLYYPLSIRLVYLLRNTGVTPNGITLFSLFLSLAGCVFFARGTHRAEIAGLILVQLSYVCDCADGQLARYRRQFSLIGGWLDQVSDRVKEFTIYFSLAFGFTRVHPALMWVWKWAIVGLFALYLLEYFGQIQVRPQRESTGLEVQAPEGLRTSEEPVPAVNSSQSLFQRMRKVRNLVPFRGFIIGEQYFALLAFLAFNAVLPLLYFVAVMGLLMCVYRPSVQLFKWYREYV